MADSRRLVLKTPQQCFCGVFPSRIAARCATSLRPLAATVHIFMPDHTAAGFLDVLPFVAVGAAVGGIFAFVIFAATAFALPMMLDRDADAVTAALTSANAVLRNKPAALLWAAVIVTLVGLSFATAFVGFVVVFPVLGHATWRAYRETIDASAWPARLGRVG